MFWGIPTTLFIPSLVLVGASFSMFAFHGILYLQYREKIIWKYCFYLGSITLYFLLDLYMRSDFKNAFPVDLEMLSTSVNFITILAYASFMMEAVNEFRQTHKRIFSIWSIAYSATIGFSILLFLGSFFLIKGSTYIVEVLSNIFRLGLVVVGLMAIYQFYPRIRGRFMNLVKWGGMIYLLFMILVLVSMFSTDREFLGLAPMHYVYAGTFIDVLIFSFAMSIKIRESLNKAAELRQTLSRDLHDEVGATLSGVTLMSELAAERIKSGRLDESRQIIQRVSDESKEMAAKMNDIVWAINPQNDSLEKVLTKIYHFGSNLCRSRQINFHFTRPENRNETMSMNKRNAIYLISKEAVNNAVKYSGAKNIFYRFTGKKDDYRLTIEDDGKGFDAGQAQTGNGLENMKARAREIGCRLDIISGTGQGTRLEIRLS